MRDQHDDAAARPHPGERAVEGGLAVAVEIGIGLVEHHHEGIAIERARQPDALALAGRELEPAFADPGVVALREFQDHVVHVGELCCLQHSLVGAARLEAGDIVGDGAVEQIDILRQIADRRAAILGRVLVERRAIERDLAACQRPDAGDRPRQRRLAGAGRSDDGQPVACLERKRNAGDRRRADAGRRDESGLDLQAASRGAGSRVSGRCCRRVPQATA